MHEYRFFRIGDGGMVDSGQRLRMTDDEAAVTHARGLDDGRLVEVWAGTRRIARLPPRRFGQSA